MPQETFAGGLALQNMVKHTLLPAALLYLPGDCDNDAAADNAASDNPALAASSGSRFWAGCVMIKDEPFQRNNL